MGSTLTAIDLCCGAGGWACAARDLPIRFVAVYDREPLYLETWRLNHQGTHHDCRRIVCDLSHPLANDQWPEEPVDIVLGGIPCEQVSIARGANKASKETMDAWHALIDNSLGIVDRLSPKYWCLEDVIQIEKHLPPWTAAGRLVRHIRINAKHYGPQSRLRTYVGDFPRPIPSPDGETQTLGDCLLPGPFATEPEPERFTVNGIGRDRGIVSGNKVRVFDEEEKLAAITSFSTSGGTNGRKFTVKASRGFVGADGVRVISPEEKMATIMKGAERGGRRRRSFMTICGDTWRRLTWQELARVQGFPDDYLFCGAMTRISDQIGQAIPIQVGRAILEAICKEGGLL
jgi:DNA (cytosine-5)-methyltransferase 1